MKRLKGSWLQILLCIALPVVVLLINNLIVVNNFAISAIPLDDSLASEDFAALYNSAFFTSFITCLVFNLIIVVAMIFMNLSSMAMWFVYLVINIGIACFHVYSFTADFPADSDTFALIVVMNVTMYFITYFVSSIFTCNDFKHFNPITKFLRK